MSFTAPTKSKHSEILTEDTTHSSSQPPSCPRASGLLLWEALSRCEEGIWNGRREVADVSGGLWVVMALISPKRAGFIRLSGLTRR